MIPDSDAFVFFGATGDLAFKQIFPALQAMTQHGHLHVPVIGVAKPEWSDDQLRARARESLEQHGGVDEEAFAILSANLKYVAGDYGDATTYERLRLGLGKAKCPLHYLAIPPALNQSGTAITSRACRSPWLKTSEPPGAVASTIKQARSGTSSRITCYR
jgi:glucose-6-phosphate 1-dehydrogenase